MTLPELLQYFTTSDTIGENKDVVERMRFYSREAQKITMKINTAYHEPEEIVSLFSELTGKQNRWNKFLEQLQRLKRRGFRLWLGDFGSGYWRRRQRGIS
jgi:hypothetical protein